MFILIITSYDKLCQSKGRNAAGFSILSEKSPAEIKSSRRHLRA